MGISRIRIHNEIKTILGDKYLSYSFVTKWIRLFIEGRENLEVEHSIYRQLRRLSRRLLRWVRYFIEEDTYCTYNEIEEETSFNR
jgi:hypothetical protein